MPRRSAPFDHYIPRVVLRGFTVAGTRSQLVVYSKEGAAPERRNLNNVFGEEDHYGDPNRELDEVFQQQENRAGEILTRWRRERQFSDSDYAALVPFLAQLLIRTPIMNATPLHMLDLAIEHCLESEVTGIRKPPMDVPDYQWPETKRAASFISKLGRAKQSTQPNPIEQDVSNWLVGLKEPRIVDVPAESFFVTGDMPMLPYPHFDGHHGPFLWFPFSSSQGLLAGFVHREVMNPEIFPKFVNFGIIRQSKKFVAAGIQDEDIRAWATGERKPHTS